MKAYLKGNEIRGKEIDFKIIDKLPKIEYVLKKTKRLFLLYINM